ncbi:hypothetical protein BC830DRAFT_382249 [Chytriomyces sp. MP71]|nr:hypothetical protein BC830DRAFT_382249 [Chytriomyces sp. MP71]
MNVSAPDNDRMASVAALSNSFDGVTIILKGADDVVANQDGVFTIDEMGSPRRCGGQGDLLTGILATFVSWMHAHQAGVYSAGRSTQGDARFTVDAREGAGSLDVPAILLACCASSVLLKRTARRAFDMKGRSMSASVMVDALGDVFSESFDEPLSKKRN